MGFLLRVVINALALGFAAWLLDGISVDGTESSDEMLTLLGVGLVFGVVNALIAPVVKLLSLPFIILTLGLFLLVINAFMLMLTSRISEELSLGFHVEDFWTAVLGALIVSIVGALLGAVVDGD